MASVASQLIEEVTAHAQGDSLEDAREICADGTYLSNNLRTYINTYIIYISDHVQNIYFIHDCLHYTKIFTLLCILHIYFERCYIKFKGKVLHITDHEYPERE